MGQRFGGIGGTATYTNQFSACTLFKASAKLNVALDRCGLHFAQLTIFGSRRNWVNNGTYLWGEATIWQEGTVPNAPGAVATFIGNNWQGYYSYLNGQQFTVGELNISGSENGGFLFQHGTLVLSDPDGSAAIHVSTSNPYTDFGEYYPTTVELASTTLIDTSDADVETLRHLVNEGMDHNTVRAEFRSGLSRSMAHGRNWQPLPHPTPCCRNSMTIISGDLRQQEIEPNHGRPTNVEEELRKLGFLRVSGPHASASTPPGLLINKDSMVRTEGHLFLTSNQIRHPFCRTRHQSTAKSQECERHHQRYSY